MILLPMILAQTSGAAESDSFGTLLTALNLGLAGVGLFAFVRGWIVPGHVYQNEKAQREKSDQAYREFVENIQNDFLPELERGRNANQTLAALLDKLLTKIRTD